eukprot:TRINITY_DN9572_c0_g1_i1.p1 TRINITY_DN9572_c0_g1~~TRINITY_DN9572_c0_g1_i1.p1  ORF type:complete len:579 (-),score=68.47 TRINITY_DN9572_c0_g1_i1:703-2439(-)
MNHTNRLDVFIIWFYISVSIVQCIANKPIANVPTDLTTLLLDVELEYLWHSGSERPLNRQSINIYGKYLNQYKFQNISNEYLFENGHLGVQYRFNNAPTTEPFLLNGLGLLIAHYYDYASGKLLKLIYFLPDQLGNMNVVSKEYTSVIDELGLAEYYGMNNDLGIQSLYFKYDAFNRVLLMVVYTRNFEYTVFTEIDIATGDVLSRYPIKKYISDGSVEYLGHGRGFIYTTNLDISLFNYTFVINQTEITFASQIRQLPVVIRNFVLVPRDDDIVLFDLETMEHQSVVFNQSIYNCYSDKTHIKIYSRYIVCRLLSEIVLFDTNTWEISEMIPYTELYNDTYPGDDQTSDCYFGNQYFISKGSVLFRNLYCQGQLFNINVIINFLRDGGYEYQHIDGYFDFVYTSTVNESSLFYRQNDNENIFYVWDTEMPFSSRQLVLNISKGDVIFFQQGVVLYTAGDDLYQYPPPLELNRCGTGICENRECVQIHGNGTSYRCNDCEPPLYNTGFNTCGTICETLICETNQCIYDHQNQTHQCGECKTGYCDFQSTSATEPEPTSTTASGWLAIPGLLIVGTLVV